MSNLSNQEIEKLTSGERIADLVAMIEDGHERDMVASMCSGIVEGFLLAKGYHRDKEDKRHGI